MKKNCKGQKNFLKFIRNSKGVTLTEFLIASGLMGLVILGAASSTYFIAKETKEIQTMLETNIDSIGQADYIKKIIENAGISLNKLRFNDNSGRNFFDYYHDMPDKALPEGQRARHFTLTPLSQNGRALILMVQAPQHGAPILYQPSHAYILGDMPSDPELSGTITFSSVNKDNRITNQRPEFWQAGRFILLEAPYAVRPLGANGLVNLFSVPRNPFFVGEVRSNTVLEMPPNTGARAEINQVLNVAHPREAGVNVTTADIFFRTIPTEAGRAPTVLVSSVDFFKFTIEPSSTPATNSMYTQRFVNGAWGEKIEIFKRVNRVEFRRSSVSRPLISFEVLE